jgi:hypothetical protein
MHLPMNDLDHPRKKAIAALRASVPMDVWQKNALFVESLRHLIVEHPVTQHPAIEMLNHGEVSMPSMRAIHLEYGYAIVQVFMDAMLAAQMQARQLETQLRPGSKWAPRFLMTLHDLDEFGFRPGVDADGCYCGNPAYAHDLLFERVLDAYGVEQHRRRNYVPSRVATAVRRCLEHSYRNYLDVTLLLATAVEMMALFEPPLRTATHVLGISVDDGYYAAHGVSKHNAMEAVIDDHDRQSDLWLVLIQALTPDQYARVQEVCLHYCDLWDRFWTYQVNKARLRQRARARRRRPFTTKPLSVSGTYAAY